MERTAVAVSHGASEPTPIPLQRYRAAREGANAMVERLVAQTCWERVGHSGENVVEALAVSAVVASLLCSRCAAGAMVTEYAHGWRAHGRLVDGRYWKATQFGTDDRCIIALLHHAEDGHDEDVR
jgi:hypothetical protein